MLSVAVMTKVHVSFFFDCLRDRKGASCRGGDDQSTELDLSIISGPQQRANGIDPDVLSWIQNDLLGKLNPFDALLRVSKGRSWQAWHLRGASGEQPA